MRNILKTLLIILFLSTATLRAGAQEAFAPLVSEDCVAFVHVDFSKVELDPVKQRLLQVGTLLLDELGFDNKAKRSTLAELQRELDKLDAMIRPNFEMLTEEIGVRELALVADYALIEQDIPPMIAVPWKDKTEKQFTALKALMQIDSPIDEPLKLGDFLVLPLGGDRGDLETWFANLKPAKESPIFDALKNVAGNEIKAVVAFSPALRKKILAQPLPGDIPQEIQGLLRFAVMKIEWISTSLSLKDFLEEPGDAVVWDFLTIKTPKPSDARQLRALMENALDMGVNFAQYQIREETPPGVFQTPPLFFEFLKGYIRTLLPQVDGDRLVFRVEGEGNHLLMGTVSAGGVMTALLLPAVQAAREAAQRMQCVNNMKQITLALHHYHDTFGGLPPLYTVDKDGKPLHSWRVLLLPFMEQQALYDQIRFDEPWDSEHNSQFHDRVIDVYKCPANPPAKPGKACCYAAIADEGLVPVKKAGERTGGTLARLTDGTSNTLFIIEVKEPFCWMDPKADLSLEELEQGLNVEDGRAGSFHPGGANIGTFDGAVRFLPDAVEKKLLRALGRPNDGE